MFKVPTSTLNDLVTHLSHRRVPVDRHVNALSPLTLQPHTAQHTYGLHCCLTCGICFTFLAAPSLTTRRGSWRFPCCHVSSLLSSLSLGQTARLNYWFTSATSSTNHVRCLAPLVQLSVCSHCPPCQEHDDAVLHALVIWQRGQGFLWRLFVHIPRGNEQKTP